MAVVRQGPGELSNATAIRQSNYKPSILHAYEIPQVYETTSCEILSVNYQNFLTNCATDADLHCVSLANIIVFKQHGPSDWHWLDIEPRRMCWVNVYAMVFGVWLLEKQTVLFFYWFILISYQWCQSYDNCCIPATFYLSRFLNIVALAFYSKLWLVSERRSFKCVIFYQFVHQYLGAKCSTGGYQMIWLS